MKTFIKYFLVLLWTLCLLVIATKHHTFIQVKLSNELQEAEKLYNETQTIERTTIGGVANDALEACLVNLNHQYSRYEILSTNYTHTTTVEEYDGNILHPNKDTCQLTVTHCVKN